MKDRHKGKSSDIGSEFDDKREFAKECIKQLEAAIASGCRDIKTLDRYAEPLYQTQIGYTGIGEQEYLHYVEYLETFAPEEAAVRYGIYEEATGLKIHVAYVAARLAKKLYKGQFDKDGKNYFYRHLAAVGCRGEDWKEKTVGFLHKAAEDTEYSVDDIIDLLKKGLKKWEKAPERPKWTDQFVDFIFQIPSDCLHFPSEAEWDEIRTALNILNARTAKNRTEYIKRFRGSILAIKVKLNDLDNSMGLAYVLSPAKEKRAELTQYSNEFQSLTKLLKKLE